MLCAWMPEKLALARGRLKGGTLMTKKNRHVGSSCESWLDETGIRSEVTAVAHGSEFLADLSGGPLDAAQTPDAAGRQAEGKR